MLPADFLQPQQLLFLRVKFFLRDDAFIQKVFIFDNIIRFIPMNQVFIALPLFSSSPFFLAPLTLSIPRSLLLLEGKMVCDHGDKLAVGGFSLDIAHRVAEELLQRFQIAAVPGHLDGVADGAFDARGRGGVCF